MRRSPLLREEASFPHQVTGVTADGRRFVNFRRWADDAPISVAEIMPDGSLRAYPDERWNVWRNAKATELSATEHLVCVQSIVPDVNACKGEHETVSTYRGPSSGSLVFCQSSRF